MKQEKLFVRRNRLMQGSPAVVDKWLAEAELAWVSTHMHGRDSLFLAQLVYGSEVVRPDALPGSMRLYRLWIEARFENLH
jgi:hypothetical protein